MRGPTRPEAPTSDASFVLERFAWGAPDRLEVTGRFAGVPAPEGAPTLVVDGDAGPHRLSCAGGAAVALGDQWAAQFLWSEPPMAFDRAELQLADGRIVALPAPIPELGDALELDVVTPDADPGAGDGQAALGLQAAVLLAEEEAREARATAAQLAAELRRAQEDLAADRARHAEDAERFRQGVEQVRGLGEQALAQAQAEIAELHARVAELESERPALTDAQERLARAEADAAQVRAESERVQAAASDAERLRARLTAVRDALQDEA